MRKTCDGFRRQQSEALHPDREPDGHLTSPQTPLRTDPKLYHERGRQRRRRRF
jgi:hypothetical protein